MKDSDWPSFYGDYLGLTVPAAFLSAPFIDVKRQRRPFYFLNRFLMENSCERWLKLLGQSLWSQKSF